MAPTTDYYLKACRSHNFPTFVGHMDPSSNLWDCRFAICCISVCWKRVPEFPQLWGCNETPSHILFCVWAMDKPQVVNVPKSGATEPISGSIMQDSLQEIQKGCAPLVPTPCARFATSGTTLIPGTVLVYICVYIYIHIYFYLFF